jgi:hypothetical protein
VGIFLLIAMMPGPLAAHTMDDPFVTDLIAGGGNAKSAIDVGEILVWNDCNYLYVKYVTDGYWTILETHLHVALSLDGIPQTKKGNPKPGHFEFHSYELLGDYVTEVTFEIPLELGWQYCVELFIAAHAVVVNGRCQVETAWGAGYDFEGKNWATFLTYITQAPKLWILPEDPVTAYVAPGSDMFNSFFAVTLEGVGEGFDIYDGVWPGWCVDKDLNFLSSWEYEVFSSYCQDLPPYADDGEQWDYINYILNNKHPDASMWEIQYAIWYFSDDGFEIPTGFTHAFEMVDDALANGEGFCPAPGQYGAIILAREGVQKVIIEVDP